MIDDSLNLNVFDNLVSEFCDSLVNVNGLPFGDFKPVKAALSESIEKAGTSKERSTAPSLLCTAYTT